MEYIILFLLIIIVIGLIFILLKYSNKNANSESNFNQQLESIRSEFRTQLNSNSEQVSSNVNSVINSLQNTIQTLQNAVTTSINTQNTSLNSQLSNVSSFMQKTSSQFGEVKQFAENIKTIHQEFNSFAEIFRNPKLRGSIGEMMLEDLLRQELPSSAYEIQYEFKNQSKVDAVIKTSNGILSIDSKFPYDNFKKMIDTKDEVEKNYLNKLFIKDVKNHIDSISKKYILPDEGTFNYAFMYIPAENIFYETIIKSENSEKSLNDYCIERKVIPVSPNSLFVHLRMVILDIKGKQVESRFNEFAANLSRLIKELELFEVDFDLLGKHLSNAQKIFEKGSKQLSKFETRLQITAPEEANNNKQLI